jgi:HD-like signal output (HDOD) protein
MKQDLDRYRVPAAGPHAAELQEAALHSTVEFLLRRMALKSEFPALSTSFDRLNRLLAQGDAASLQPVADLVMCDFALTQKLLRVVNSAAYGNRQITKVSQAIAILGMAQLRSIATALMLSNASKAGANSPRFSAALSDAFVAGVIARNIGRLVGLVSVEELFICGMFSRLGQLLTLFYLPDEHEAIEQRMREGSDAASAARAVLGLSHEQLGAEVAKHWNFPALIVDAMRALPQGRLGDAGSDAERMWHCAGYARELCALASEASAATCEAQLAAHVDRFAEAVPVAAAQVHALAAHSVELALKYAAAAGVDAATTPLIAGLERLRQIQTAPAEADSPNAPVVPVLPNTPSRSPTQAERLSPVPRPRERWITRWTRAWRTND